MNYQDWKSTNPNKSINDYYIAFPEKKSQPLTIITNVVPVNNVKKKITEKTTDYLLLLVSILIIVAFFMPWVNIKIIGVNLVNNSGAEISSILKFIYKDAPQIERFVNTIYLIPFGAILVLLGEGAKIFSIKALGEVLVFVLMGIWFYALYAVFNYAINQYGLSISIGDFYGIGMYLTLAGSLYYLVNIIKEFFD